MFSFGLSSSTRNGLFFFTEWFPCLLSNLAFLWISVELRFALPKLPHTVPIFCVCAFFPHLDCTPLNADSSRVFFFLPLTLTLGIKVGSDQELFQFCKD